MNETIDNARNAAYAADDAYSAELIRVYGKKAASTMRYQPNEFKDAALIAARKAKLAADTKWIAALAAA